MTAIVLRGDARALPLPDNSVDLIVTSPPYWALRRYLDGGEQYAGQIGSEATPAEWVAALVECTREWMRVLKPKGSMFVNLADKYSERGHGPNRGRGTSRGPQSTILTQTRGPLEKSLLGLPWRYALACMDELGLILRRDQIWSKPNPVPESASDRCVTKHEYVFHLVKQRNYYTAIDELREPQATRGQRHAGRSGYAGAPPGIARSFDTRALSPLGKLPGSVWEIAVQPLILPASLGVDHRASFPMELPRRCILGWSPPGICTACSEGRFPVTEKARNVYYGHGRHRSGGQQVKDGAAANGWAHDEKWESIARIVGYACACPQPDAPARAAVVADPFGGTGTTALVASALGRIGITVDLSHDYGRAARWRTTDPGERARALGLPKPPPPPAGMDTLFDASEAAS